MASTENILNNSELFELIAINNNVFTGNSNGELFLKGEAGECVWEETKELFAKVEQAAVAKYIASQPSPMVFNLSLAHAEAYIKQLEEENQKEYVGRGADAYNHSCSELVAWQQERALKGLDVGPSGSLIEWMMWAQEFMDNFNVPDGLESLATDVEQILELLEENEWAELISNSELGKRLEQQITRLHCPALLNYIEHLNQEDAYALNQVLDVDEVSTLISDAHRTNPSAFLDELVLGVEKAVVLKLRRKVSEAVMVLSAIQNDLNNFGELFPKDFEDFTFACEITQAAWQAWKLSWTATGLAGQNPEAWLAPKMVTTDAKTAQLWALQGIPVKPLQPAPIRYNLDIASKLNVADLVESLMVPNKAKKNYIPASDIWTSSKKN